MIKDFCRPTYLKRRKTKETVAEKIGYNQLLHLAKYLINNHK
jgi:hypothetical protein